MQRVTKKIRLCVGIVFIGIVVGCGNFNRPAVYEPDSVLFDAVLSREDASVLIIEVDGVQVDFSEDPDELKVLRAVKSMVLPARKLANMHSLPADRILRVLVQTGKDPILIDVVSVGEGKVRFVSEFVTFRGGSLEALEVVKDFFHSRQGEDGMLPTT
ncbi:hypothetical protein [Rhodopirellula sp. MGV]|uniref:hypothetical protein n=1 Tax=Rhodopirellula sp. MGV TaxID=2023130 RepID=UPI000BD60BF9|nr:hypothetical protein [Rhodopirellula sp. MGV]OYP36788.1 hypothetical protein CGZ80_06980 [Rhodopirellula sp. MGV]